MNDYNNDLSQYEVLQKELYRLKEENLFLKEEIRRLNNQIAGLNSMNNNVNTDSPLVEYYINRYLEIHNYVLENRINLLDQDIIKAQEEYEELSSKEDMIELIANKNAEIKKEMSSIEATIELNYETLSKVKEEFRESADDATNKENNIYRTTVDYYNSLISKLSIGDLNDTREYMNFVVDVLKYTLHDEVVKYHASARKALAILDDMNTLEYEMKNENILLQNRYEEISKDIEVISFEETEKKLDALVYEITNKKIAKQELTELFDTLRKDNIKFIKDEIKHLQILENSNQNIAIKLDEIVLSFKDSLGVADTASNILCHKKIELQKYNDKIEIIYPYYEQYQHLNTEYKELQNMFEIVNNNIDSIENYLSQAKKLIDNNGSFKKTVRDYTETKLKLDSIESSLESVKIREKTLAETRKQILNDPYGKTDLIRIDDELRQVQETVASFSSECNSLKSKIYQLKETEQDMKIISIYEETLSCEKQLPTLYNKQKNLGTLINDKYQELCKAKDKSNGYEDLKSKIEALEDEIANLQ